MIRQTRLDDHTGPGPGTEVTGTILLVEDDASVRAIVGDVLRWQGYTVLEADGGATALAIAESHAGSIDLLVTDVGMPAMTGPELAEHVLAHLPGLKVLFLSGYPAAGMTAHGLLPPGRPLLEKPFNAHVLLTTVRHLLARSAGDV
jgi:CheY-like chemotaxis protein